MHLQDCPHEFSLHRELVRLALKSTWFLQETANQQQVMMWMLNPARKVDLRVVRRLVFVPSCFSFMAVGICYATLLNQASRYIYQLLLLAASFMAGDC